MRLCLLGSFTLRSVAPLSLSHSAGVEAMKLQVLPKLDVLLLNGVLVDLRQ